MMKQYVRGLQHIGVPSKDVAATVKFYEGLGFDCIMQCKNGTDDVAFLQIGSLVIETYTFDAVGYAGAVDHIAIDVTDIEAVFALAKQGGYKLIDEEIVPLPFFENGVRYFMIEGPNGERLEFNQKL